MNLLQSIRTSISENKNRNAFFINGNSYTYEQLGQSIANIKAALASLKLSDNQNIGLIINDDLETYASIIALWFEGHSYVPLSLDSPEERNLDVINQADINIVLDSSNKIDFEDIHIIHSSALQTATINLAPSNFNKENLAYIFFTSGTTGKPKGVPISFKNLATFCDAFEAMDCKIDNTDRCLQMFELTFDLSVMSYLIPLLKGACIYTIPKEEIKYSYIFELMEDEKLTFALMVPSILHYLRPYFDEIDCPDMKNSLFCGEALPLDVAQEWSNCVPNARIMNVYGPTEHTIFCTELMYKRDDENKAYNGVLSIGKDMRGTTTIIVDQNNDEVAVNVKGELCLSGDQLTNGYWKNPEKNKEAFFNKNGTRFYRTGDLCFKDAEGDIMYSGRIDFQAKIQGFRVELSEVELYAKQGLEKVNAVAVAFNDSLGNTQIGLAIESEESDTSSMLDYMKSKMPPYMIPSSIKFVPTFPLNTNGKIDRKKITTHFTNNI